MDKPCSDANLHTTTWIAITLLTGVHFLNTLSVSQFIIVTYKPILKKPSPMARDSAKWSMSFEKLLLVPLLTEKNGLNELVWEVNSVTRWKANKAVNSTSCHDNFLLWTPEMARQGYTMNLKDETKYIARFIDTLHFLQNGVIWPCLLPTSLQSKKNKTCSN